MRRLFVRSILGVGAVLLLMYGGLLAFVRPSNDRDWSPDQVRLALASFAGDTVHVRNVRNAFYRGPYDYDVRWEDRSYDLTKLESVWFMVEPFSDVRGPAHTLLSFGFSDGQYVGISVELRKEKGEAFSPVKGLFRQYELTYVVGDERDLLGLRANHRRDSVYLYRVNTSWHTSRSSAW